MTMKNWLKRRTMSEHSPELTGQLGELVGDFLADCNMFSVLVYVYYV
uniref:MFS transporter n=1 Tax=Heterorhabditis bacteriophora TaxID=37862 RepID=A0A1I7XGP5_HETBA